MTKVLGLVAIIIFFFPSLSLAIHASMGSKLVAEDEENSIPFSFRISIEGIEGEANEYVYDEITGDKVSQLDWELESVLMLGGIASLKIKDWLQLNVGGWTAIVEGHGEMEDRDWSPEVSSDWSHWSGHSAELMHGYVLDANMVFPFEIDRSLHISPLIGFKYENFKWNDLGGRAIYSTNGWRNDYREFPDDEIGIIYEQRFYVPYLGLNVGGSYRGFFSNMYATYSAWAWSEGRDQHLNRSLEFLDEIDQQEYIGAGVELGYNINQWLFVALSYDYQEFCTAKGTTEMQDTVSGEIEYFGGDDAGIALRSGSLSLTLGGKF